VTCETTAFEIATFGEIGVTKVVAIAAGTKHVGVVEVTGDGATVVKDTRTPE
jgi:hypothetical protein